MVTSTRLNPATVAPLQRRALTSRYCKPRESSRIWMSMVVALAIVCAAAIGFGV